MLLSILGGFVLLLAGGESLVRGSVAVASRLGVSPLLIGLTLVGFGTSTPELVTSLDAAFVGAPGIAVGNVVGSNIANILLILGLTAAIRAIPCEPKAFARDGLIVAVAALACVPIAFWGSVDRLAGVVLVALLIAYLVYTYLAERTPNDPAGAVHAEQASDSGADRPLALWLALPLALVGIGATILGANLLVDGSVALAAKLGVSDSVIGLTLVAVGTSLPELVACVVAALRGHSAVALGNVLGSNIYNILAILGITAIVHPIPFPADIARQDLWIMLAATLLLMVFARSGWRIGRREGALLTVGYVGYLALLALEN